MDVAEQLVAGLQEFVQSVPSTEQHDDTEPMAVDGIALDVRMVAWATTLAQASSATLWHKLNDNGPSFTAITKCVHAFNVTTKTTFCDRALGVALMHAQPATALHAATLYSWLLQIPGCPVCIDSSAHLTTHTTQVLNALHELTLTGALRALLHAAPTATLAKAKHGSKAARAQGDDQEAEAPAATIPDAATYATQVLRNLNATLRRHRLPESSDALASVCEAAVMLLFSSPPMPGWSSIAQAMHHAIPQMASWTQPRRCWPRWQALRRDIPSTPRARCSARLQISCCGVTAPHTRRPHGAWPPDSACRLPGVSASH